MASALQCPACGHKHRLSELSGDPIFSCEQCGRLLKTPVEYRRPEPSSPGEPPRPSTNTSTVQRGGSATRDQTSVLRTTSGAAAGTAAAGTPPRPRRSSSMPPATLTLPLQILGWLVALVLGGVIVRYLARFTGLVTGDSVIDLITGSGWMRYMRLFAVVPIWALVTAGLMTGFVEGARWWKARQMHTPKPRPAARRTTTVPAKPPSAAAPKPGPQPKPAPSPRPSGPNPAAAETRSPSGAASTPRARRIPKRDLSSEP